jgi:hypothetical protein
MRCPHAGVHTWNQGAAKPTTPSILHTDSHG